MSRFLSHIFLILSPIIFGQSYAPAPGVSGSTAIHRDSSIIVNWANAVDVVRGPWDIQDQNSPLASYGANQDAMGYADDYPVSLGDGGIATVTFPFLIEKCKPANSLRSILFENGFSDNYMELAFVEVSSDGVNFFRFNAVSETPTETQLSNTSFSDCRYIHNLAGKYRVFYGTPFDLEELIGTPGLDVNMISHVRLIDVVGSINPLYGSYDSQGTIINDPFTTPWESGGFDLDAVAVINESSIAGIMDINNAIEVLPNPCVDNISIKTVGQGMLRILNFQGQLILSKETNGNTELNMRDFSSGFYFVTFTSEFGIFTKRILKN